MGFMGTMARDEYREPVEGFAIYILGSIGSDSHLGKLVRRGMTGIVVTQLLPVVQELMIEHFGAKTEA